MLDVVVLSIQAGLVLVSMLISVFPMAGRTSDRKRVPALRLSEFICRKREPALRLSEFICNPTTLQHKNREEEEGKQKKKGYMDSITDFLEFSSLHLTPRPKKEKKRQEKLNLKEEIRKEK